MCVWRWIPNNMGLGRGNYWRWECIVGEPTELTVVGKLALLTVGWYTNWQSVAAGVQPQLELRPRHGVFYVYTVHQSVESVHRPELFYVLYLGTYSCPTSRGTLPWSPHRHLLDSGEENSCQYINITSGLSETWIMSCGKRLVYDTVTYSNSNPFKFPTPPGAGLRTYIFLGR